MAERETRYGRLKTWFEDHPVFAPLILSAVAIVFAVGVFNQIREAIQGFFPPEERAMIAGIELPAYIVLDNAYARQQQAQRRLADLHLEGYKGTGFFWIPDFEYLSETELFQVYVGPFESQDEAVEAACQYERKFGTETYGLRLSDEPRRDEFTCDQKPRTKRGW